MAKVTILVPIDSKGHVRRVGVLLRLLSLPYGDFDINVAGDVSSILESRSMGLDALSGIRLAVKVLHDVSRPLNGVVHAFFWYIRPTAGRLILEADQSPSQFFTGYLNMALAKGPVKALYRDSIIVTWSRWARDGFLRDGFREDQVKVVPLPYVEGVFKASAVKERAVAFIGYDYYRKGGDIALRVMAVVKAVDPAVKAIYVGKMPHSVPRFIDEYHPYLPRARVLQILAKSMVALAPSRHEAYGLAAMDAMANGAVVIASDVEGLGEFVKANGGVACPLNDLDCLVENTLKYLDEKNHEAKASLQLERLRQNHDPAKIRGMMRRVYEEAVKP